MSCYSSDDEDDLVVDLPEDLKPVEIEPPKVEFTQDVEVKKKWETEDEATKSSQLVEDIYGKKQIPLIAMNPDEKRVPGQNIAVVSVVWPQQYSVAHARGGQRKYRGLLLKIRGVFETREEADKWIRECIFPSDPHFDVFMIKCHEWSGVEDDDVTEREYLDEGIHSIMSDYFDEENNRNKELADRIEYAKNKTKRSKESRKFFEQANIEAGHPEMNDPQTAIQALRSEDFYQTSEVHADLPDAPGTQIVQLDDLAPGRKVRKSGYDEDTDELSQPPPRRPLPRVKVEQEGTFLSTVIEDEDDE